MAQRYSWISVVTPEQFEEIKKTDAYQDANNFFVQWCQVDPGPKEDRKATVTLVYSEARATNEALLLPDHKREWKRFYEWAPRYDAAFGHTPWMVEQVSAAGLPGHLFPLGWDPEVMGSPRWSVAKQHDIVFYGSKVGKRAFVLPYFHEKLGIYLKDISGMFGRTLTGALDTARASLYVAHSDVDSFSTWRLWQTAATSAALIAEPGDMWPFVYGEHVADIPRVTFSNVDEVVDKLNYYIHGNLMQYAERAHELARKFTVDHCVTSYLIPASAKIVRKR
jgi:hypothetical protein